MSKSKTSNSLGPGKIVIISSPSGGGKSSICRELLRKHAADKWKFSISFTTRPIREGEKDGREYHFTDATNFKKLRKAGKFAESCRVHKFRYATPRAPLEDTVRRGGVILLDVDVKGASKLRKEYPHAALIFILPPSRKELERRLRTRGTDSAAQLRLRLAVSLREMRYYTRFDYTVINDNLDKAVHEVECIIETLHTRRGNLDRRRIDSMIGI